MEKKREQVGSMVQNAYYFAECFLRRYDET